MLQGKVQIEEKFVALRRISEFKCQMSDGVKVVQLHHMQLIFIHRKKTDRTKFTIHLIINFFSFKSY